MTFYILVLYLCHLDRNRAPST